MKPGYLPDSYFAGFFDADGCVQISKASGNTGGGWRCRVTVVNTDRRVLELYADRFGGCLCQPVTREANRKPVHRWTLDVGVRDFLEAVAEFVVVKSERVRVALAFCDLPPLPRGRMKPQTRKRWEELRAQRSEFYDEMKTLNQRGVVA